MYKISKKMAYAIEAVVDIAYYGNNMPVQSRDITRRQDIPERYLEQSLQCLVRVGILRGVRGPRGGYRLARPADRISAGEIAGVIRAMDLNGNGTNFFNGSALGQQVIQPVLEALDREVMERLDRISVAELVTQAAERRIADEDAASDSSREAAYA